MKCRILMLSACAAAVLILAACSSGPQVSRVDAETQTDLSGYWNDTDLRTVSDSLIAECLSSPRVAAFEKNNGRLPVVIVGTFRNDSDEHIDTSIIAKKMEAAILNSGLADFVASRNERSEIREERQEQQSFASEDSAKALANEAGADFILTGSVKTIVDKAGKTATRTYFVYGELTDVDTNKKIWMGENNQIKKIIKTPSAKF